MITTKDINVILEKGQGKLKQITTKNVDASIKVVQPKEPVKPKSISTHSMADVADIMDKKKRDDIMAQRRANRAIKADEKEIVMVEKKPWKEMTDDEKKVEMERRTAKAKATRERKKEK